jgi:Transcriptional Coactivator p15 (PC4)
LRLAPVRDFGHHPNRRSFFGLPSWEVVMTELVIASIEKNSREVLRVTLDDFKGHRLVNLRGDYRPGKHGLALRVDKLEGLIAALIDAQAQANQVGWLAPATSSGICRRDLQ